MAYHTAMKPRQHLSDHYDRLSYLEGADIRILSGIDTSLPPEKVTIVKDLGRNLLLELTFVKSIWGLNIPQRSYKRMVLKQAIACGDVKLATMDGYPINVSHITYQEGVKVNESEN